MLPITHPLLPALLAVLVCGLAHPISPAQPAASSPGSTRPAAPAKPASNSSNPHWASLTPSQQSVLAPLAKEWSGIDGPRKAKWLEVASRFPQMRPEDQARVQERMAEWARMTPLERGQARLTFQETKQLSAEEKQQRWEAYNALPESERQALAERSRRQAERAKPATTPPAALNESIPKQNLVSATSASAPRSKPVAPTVVQAKPGATTTLMNKAPSPPSHQQPGQPKIAAKPGDVDPATLLPKSGPQAAASAPLQP